MLVLTFPLGAQAAEIEDISSAWERALRFEEEGALLESAALFEWIARSQPERSDACWRAARSHWRFGEQLALRGHEARFAYFELAERWAQEGLDRDPECGECYLWKYAGMGRMVEQRGMFWAARHCGQMRRLVDRGIELRPQHRDPNGNVTLANLYYASAVLYRMVPEWFWVRFVFGLRGDTELALDHIRRALDFSGDRVDYRVEHGAILLCMGVRRGQPERTREGLEVLETALALPPIYPTDPIDQAYARYLLAEPAEACGFSRMGFIDLEGEGGRQLAQRLRRGERTPGVSAPPPDVRSVSAPSDCDAAPERDAPPGFRRPAGIPYPSVGSPAAGRCGSPPSAEPSS